MRRVAKPAACSLLVLLIVGANSQAHAYPFKRLLREGSRGRDVRALEVRVAGWFPRADQTAFRLSKRFGPKTTAAVKAFQAHYGLTVDGIAGPDTFAVLNRLEEKDGSTRHFAWGEFDQNYNPGCSSQANAYAGTFGGGMVSPKRAKRNVRRLMWRLEAVRAKGGSHPIGVNSGFRSVKYNQCIGGAGLSQHMYGTAADNRMAKVTNRRERNLAKRSQISGIGCYSTTSHNHLDLRLNNEDLPQARYWWWPRRDSKGRDLDATGRPCWGERKRGSKIPATTTSGVLRAIRAQLRGSGSLVPTAREIAVFERTGEFGELSGAD